MKLAVESGCRKGSLLGLRWRGVDFEAGRALVERTKNEQPQVIVLLLDTLAELARFEGKSDELLFPGKRKVEKPHAIDTAFDFTLKTRVATLESILSATPRSAAADGHAEQERWQ